MSVDTCFYAVSKISSELAEPLERDKLGDDCEYVDQEKASDWMKEIGQLRTLRYTRRVMIEGAVSMGWHLGMSDEDIIKLIIDEHNVTEDYVKTIMKKISTSERHE